MVQIKNNPNIRIRQSKNFLYLPEQLGSRFGLLLIAALGIIITAAYILRAVHNVFFGEYDADKWHDMRPILAIDKFALIMFSALMILIGVAPNVIAPIVESGMIPVVERIESAQQVVTVMDSVQVAATNFFQLFGGA